MKKPYFLSHDGHKLFALYEAPIEDRTAREGVRICPPAPYEMRRAHRALRNLSQSLSKRGFHVLRLDYRGTGDSSGEQKDWSLSAWQSDILRGIDELIGTYEVERISLVGLRLGGSLAYTVSRKRSLRRVILWDGVYEGETYLQSMRKTHLKLCEREQDRPPYQRQDPIPQLFGYPLSKEWERELETLRLNLEDGGRGLVLETEGTQSPSSYGLFKAQKIAENLKWNDPMALQLQTYAHASIKAIEQALEGKV